MKTDVPKFRIRLLLLSFLLSLLTVFPSADAQGIRCIYQFQSRDNVDKPFRTSGRHMLDGFSGRYAFYPEIVFLADSLENIAFDEKGKTVDQKAYEERTRLRISGHRDITLTEHRSGELLQCYQTAIVFVIGRDKLDPPAWELTEDTCTVAGYLAQKAVADYLGRRWEVWFTPELPLATGPWMLWGAPGLIVLAADADGLFRFELQAVEKLDTPSRIDFLRWFHLARERSKKRHFDLPLSRAESICYKMRTDVEFLHEASGMSGGRTYRIDATGQKREVKTMPYTPLIPPDYLFRDNTLRKTFSDRCADVAQIER